MYIARGQEGFEFGNLRQGDILEGVPFPHLDLETIQLLGEIPPDTDFNFQPGISLATRELRKGSSDWIIAQIPIKFGFSIVLSNCCDLELRKDKIPAPVFTLARLHPIPESFKKNAESYDSLKANKDPRDDNDPGYIDFFYLEPHEQLNNLDWRVHFNQVSTLPTDPLTLLLRKKILQLDDRTRMKFKIKLGYTLFRTNAEEEAAGLENPWQEPQDAKQAGDS